jgi:hypothetical protein
MMRYHCAVGLALVMGCAQPAVPPIAPPTIASQHVATCHVSGQVFKNQQPVELFGVAVVGSAEILIDRVTEIRHRDGSFDVEVPQCGYQDVVIGGPGFARRMFSGVQIDGATDLGRIDVSDGRVVRGRVTDAAGQPVPDVTVRIGSTIDISDPLVRILNGRYETTTDRDGAYEFTGISQINRANGSHISAGVTGRLSSGEFRFPDQDVTMNLVVLPIGSVFGNVAQTPQTTPHIVFLRSISNPALILGAIANAGRFEIDDVPIGDYDAFDDPLAKTTKRIGVAAGAAVNVSFP